MDNKEKLEEAKRLYETANADQRYVLESLFSELRENEDRIPKEIIKFLKEFGGFRSCWIVWLEKQGEQKPVDKVEPKFHEGDIMRTLEEAKEGITDGLPVVVSIDEEYYHCNNELISIKDQDKYEYPPMNRKQKPAWSEEDERMYRRLHNLIYSTSYCDSRKEFSDFLNSLKDRVQIKPQQEWSEEDEKCIRLSTDIIDSALRAGFCVQLDRDRCIDWLKSLSPQSQWKPSDEQMKALWDSIPEDVKEISEREMLLNELYKDLKKL